MTNAQIQAVNEDNMNERRPTAWDWPGVNEGPTNLERVQAELDLCVQGYAGGARRARVIRREIRRIIHGGRI